MIYACFSVPNHNLKIVCQKNYEFRALIKYFDRYVDACCIMYKKETRTKHVKYTFPNGGSVDIFKRYFYLSKRYNEDILLVTESISEELKEKLMTHTVEAYYILMEDFYDFI